jgi:DNA-binding NarL/FixJ family response regulator
MTSAALLDACWNARTQRMYELLNASNVMRVLDAVYDVEHPREQWLHRILQSAASALDLGTGVGTLLYTICGPDQLTLNAIDGLNIPAGFRELGSRMHHEPRLLPLVIEGYRSVLCCTLPELVGDQALLQTVHTEYYGGFHVADQIVVNGLDCSGEGVALYLFAQQPLQLSSEQRDLLTRLATHLTTGYRLQRQLAARQSSSWIEPSAVLTPDGGIDKLAPCSTGTLEQDALKHAVQERERARSASAGAAVRAVKAMKGLVSARWTLVDQYERGGKRYVVAHENAPQPREPMALSERERQVVALAALGRSNKFIAYELGLAHSTVRVLMARACAKLGVASRSELITQQHALVPH